MREITGLILTLQQSAALVVKLPLYSTESTVRIGLVEQFPDLTPGTSESPPRWIASGVFIPFVARSSAAFSLMAIFISCTWMCGALDSACLMLFIFL